MAKKNIAANLRKRNLRTSENPAVSKKGMELPINTLVVVAIAVIVILAIAAFFMGGFGGSSKDIQNRQAFLNACSSWVQTGCNNADFTSSIEDTFKVWQPTVDLESLTDALGNKVDKKDYLAGKCGCFGAGTGTRSSTTTPTGTATTCKAAGGIGCYGEEACTKGGGSKMTKSYECVSPQICCKAGAAPKPTQTGV